MVDGCSRQAPAALRAQSTSAVWEAARKAREAARKLSALPNEDRNDALERMAKALENAKGDIEKANALDCEKAAKPEAKVAAPLQARLKFGGAKLRDTITGVRDLKKLADPIGLVQLHRELAPGLTMKRITVPLGVLGIIFEARPDAAVQIASLGVKSGNGVLLKCGREAVESCKAILTAIQDGLATSKASPDVVALLTTREETAEMLKMKEYIDLIIPRGSNEFVQYVMQNTDIAVLGHADGICHTYVDKAADLAMAVEIASDAKIQVLLPARLPACPLACLSVSLRQDMGSLLERRDVAVPVGVQRCRDAAGAQGRSRQVFPHVRSPLQAGWRRGEGLPGEHEGDELRGGDGGGLGHRVQRQDHLCQGGLGHGGSHGAHQPIRLAPHRRHRHLRCAGCCPFPVAGGCCGGLLELLEPFRRRFPLRFWSRGRHLDVDDAPARPRRARGPCHLPLLHVRVRAGCQRLRRRCARLLLHPQRAPPLNAASWARGGALAPDDGRSVSKR